MDADFCHPIIGNEDVYKKEQLEGTHRPCLLAVVAMTKQSILDLLVSASTQWICSTCHFRDNHEAMLSVIPACPTCGLSLEDTIGIYTSMWIDGLVRRNVMQHK